MVTYLVVVVDLHSGLPPITTGGLSSRLGVTFGRRHLFIETETFSIAHKTFNSQFVNGVRDTKDRVARKEKRISSAEKRGRSEKEEFYKEQKRDKKFLGTSRRQILSI